jgi:hypothetical protein
MVFCPFYQYKERNTGSGAKNSHRFAIQAIFLLKAMMVEFGGRPLLKCTKRIDSPIMA